MERCTLCGGAVVNGRCRECGLDNTKNDKKYRLNTHNSKAVRLHAGDCEENLNQPERKPAKRRIGADNGYGIPANRQTAAGKKNPVRTQPSGAGRTAQRTADVRTEKTGAERNRELRKRRQTGTVQRKRGKGWIVAAVIAVSLLQWLAFGIADWVDKHPDWSVSFGDSFEVHVPEEGPAPENWDTEAGGYYYEEMLAPGFYTAGYDFPAGTYQFSCLKGAAWVEYQSTASDEWQYVCLYSEEMREEESPFFPYSEVLEFPEGSRIYVETSDPGLQLAGIKNTDAELLAHEPQGLSEEIVAEDGMEAGKDFPAGVYQVSMQEADYEYGYADAYVTVSSDEYESRSLFLNQEVPAACRIPFEDGATIEVSFGGDADRVVLAPSY